MLIVCSPFQWFMLEWVRELLGIARWYCERSARKFNPAVEVLVEVLPGDDRHLAEPDHHNIGAGNGAFLTWPDYPPCRGQPG